MGYLGEQTKQSCVKKLANYHGKDYAVFPMLREKGTERKGSDLERISP